MNDEQKRIVDALQYLALNNVSTMGFKRPPQWIVDEDIYVEDLAKMSADMIEQMAAELEQVKRERDAAIHDLQKNNQSRRYQCQLTQIRFIYPASRQTQLKIFWII